LAMINLNPTTVRIKLRLVTTRLVLGIVHLRAKRGSEILAYRTDRDRHMTAREVAANHCAAMMQGTAIRVKMPFRTDITKASD
jgi:hypothetical protein